MTAAMRDRAHGALLGLAIGDALGMPTQYMAREVIADRYGILDGFHPGPEENPISRGMAAGRVTDDTDQAVILGNLLVAGRGHVDAQRMATEFLDWERRMIEAGSADLLGPSTRKALALITEGTPVDEAGRTGATNGAAMRIAPVGIAFPAQPLADLIAAVVDASYMTHNTTIGIAGAAAVAAAVSVGVAGRPLAEALEAAVQAARLGARHGCYFAGPDVADRMRWAMDLMRGCSADQGLDRIYRLVGTGVATQEAVPAAAAICLLAPHDPWLVCRLAGSVGGDCDTVAAMAGAIMGACHGAAAFPPEAVAQLQRANPDLKLEALADGLLALRDAGPDGDRVAAMTQAQQQ